jgi:hypothetical protein
MTQTDLWGDEVAAPSLKVTGLAALRLPMLSSRLFELGLQHERISAEIEAIEEELTTLVPDEPGEHLLEAGDFLVKATRGERWTWDRAELERMFTSEEELPDFVKRTISVDKRKFQDLTPAEQSPLLDALTRKPSKPAFEVTKR